MICRMQDTDQTLRQEGREMPAWQYWGVNLLLLVTAVLLGFGLVMPLITFKQLVLFSNSFSVLSGVVTLFSQQQYLLFVVVSVFSVLIPVLKLVLLIINWNFPGGSRQWRSRLLGFSKSIARWSMLDVFVVAVFVVLIKINLIAEVETHPGLVVFTIAVITLMILTVYVNHELRRRYL